MENINIFFLIDILHSVATPEVEGKKTQRRNKRAAAAELREAKLTLGHVISWEGLAAVNEAAELPHLSGALGRSSSPMGLKNHPRCGYSSHVEEN